jgi:hypothetical protein
MEVQAVAMRAPERLPAKPGLMYRPPVQSVMEVNWCFLQGGSTGGTGVGWGQGSITGGEEWCFQGSGESDWS